MKKINEVIDVRNIIFTTETMSKEETIESLVELLSSNDYIDSSDDFKKEVYTRENEVSTSVGYGVAIPHAQSVSVKKPAVVILRNWSGIQWGKDKVNLVFMIAANKEATEEHLKILSQISTFLMNDSFRAKLLTAESPEEVIEALNNEEDKENLNDYSKNVKKDSGKYLIGITSCMTGIAHTFMAAEGLVNAAKERGMRVKIQTNGSTGIENKLTKEDVEEADVIIVAHDVKVDTSVLGNKAFLDVPVKQAINNAEDILDRALKLPSKELDQNTSQNDSSEEYSSKNDEESNDNNNFAKAFYTHIMSGVSYMIPFVVVGGIFIALSFMFGINSSDPNSDQYNVFAAFLNEVGGNSAFELYVPVLAGFIAWSIADKAALAPGMIGGLMAANGGSGFLGGMVGGFLAGYLTRFIVSKTKKVPHVYQGLLSVLFIPLITTFGVGVVMYFLLNTPMAAFNNFLTSWLQTMRGANAALLGAILAGMMASDMGGPINKTASAFGLAMFAAQVYEPSAALMVGGMVPPLGIAIATLLFKNKFTNQERDAGKANWFLGACFITEGAIPFAAADPLRTIPANVIGSAIGGAVCMANNIALQAPHGGIIVIPIACNKPILYIFSILLGSLITALVLGFTKKKLDKKEMDQQMAGGII